MMILCSCNGIFLLNIIMVKVYQVQACENGAKIVQVGEICEVVDVKVAEFTTFNDCKCMMVSKLYDRCEEVGIWQMMAVNVGDKGVVAFCFDFDKKEYLVMVRGKVLYTWTEFIGNEGVMDVLYENALSEEVWNLLI